MDEQARLRENLGKVPAGSDLQKRYLATLDKQENDLETLAGRRAEAALAEVGHVVDRLLEPAERLGAHGTIVYMPACDRLSSRKARTLGEHAVGEMARIYRRAISGGLRLYVNNRRVEAFDPTYSLASARHAKALTNGAPTTSRLVLSRPIDIPVSENDPTRVSQIVAKVFALPIDEWSHLDRKTQKNDLRIFDGLTVSILRNDREHAFFALTSAFAFFYGFVELIGLRALGGC